MELYATKEATIAFLEQLGFTRVVEDELFFDSPKSDFGGAIIQLFVYQCANGYWCVDADNGYMAPVVWNGPKADWDKSSLSDEFVAWLDNHHPGWRQLLEEK